MTSYSYSSYSYTENLAFETLKYRMIKTEYRYSTLLALADWDIYVYTSKFEDAIILDCICPA